RKRRRDPAPIANSPRRDDRQAHRVARLRQERKQGGLSIDVVRKEHPAMSARLTTLHDDPVDFAFFQPARLGDSGGRGKNQRAARFDPRKQRRTGQAKMKADDLRTRFLDGLAHLLVEGRARWPRPNTGEGESGFGIEARESSAPTGLDRRIRRRLYVTEKVHV